MGAQGIERKLTTIFIADVEGYSRLMGVDEEATLRALRACREIIDGLIGDHRGRVFGSAGDSVLAEFASAVEAVRCAAKVQEAIAARNAELSEDRPMRFRIGINLGDVMVDGDNLFGDGVNIAARVEGSAEPGEICISGPVFDQVRNKLDLGYQFLGEREVRNIREPVRMYRIVTEPATAGEVSGVGKRSVPRWEWVAAAAVAVAIVAGAVVWVAPWAPDVEPASIERMAFALPDKPSIAVLPFANMSDDPAQEYFADGITEDLITDLSKISGLFVIARNSTFTYKGRSVKIKRVAEDLGVRYVLEGSVRRVGDQVRITAQLIDATTGGHVWAERYDGALADVFDLQDRVTQKIVAALAVKLTAGEKAERDRPETDNPEAYDSFLRGWAHYRRHTPDDFAEAVPYFERAVELDPSYGRAYAALAAVYWSIVDKNWSSGTSAWSLKLGLSTEEALRREEKYLQQAVKNPVSLAHRVASGRLSRQGKYEEAIAEAARAIALDPNDPVGHEAMVTALIYAGMPAEAVGQIGQAMRLDPRFPDEYLFWLGLAEFGLENFEAAADALVRSARGNPDDDRSLIVLASAYGHLGRVREAKSAIETANRLRRGRQEQLTDAGFKVGIDMLLVGPYTLDDVDLWPIKEQVDRERLREGLRLAGVPSAGQEKAVSPIQVAGATTVDAAEAKELSDRGVAFVDVRGRDSWNNGHVPGAVHLFLQGGFSEAALSRVVAKGQEVVIYCMGPRCLLSSTACVKAVEWGFEKVYYFREGFPSWKAAGYRVAVP